MMTEMQLRGDDGGAFRKRSGCAVRPPGTAATCFPEGEATSDELGYEKTVGDVYQGIESGDGYLGSRHRGNQAHCTWTHGSFDFEDSRTGVRQRCHPSVAVIADTAEENVQPSIRLAAAFCRPWLYDQECHSNST